MEDELKCDSCGIGGVPLDLVININRFFCFYCKEGLKRPSSKVEERRVEDYEVRGVCPLQCHDGQVSFMVAVDHKYCDKEIISAVVSFHCLSCGGVFSHTSDVENYCNNGKWRENFYKAANWLCQNLGIKD